MPLIDIHGHQVHIDEGSDSAKHAVHFLNEHPNDAHAFFDEAKRNLVSGVSHFEINRPAGYMGSTKFTLVHHDDGKYTLRKKEHHLL
jgi:hypothetical protein